ncbi:MAG: class I SAM-dependent methyltransferase [Rhizobiaceae bacterium]|nr:class I SAM-dependent methyltransferase [Rhizobiaceae bacterium]
MTALKAKIVALIQTVGPISVAEYMASCLSDPEHGYYPAREPFGSAGDFVTAPEISQMFGELIGAWVVRTWQAMGSPGDVILAEVGPGRGTLMKDMARTIGKLAPRLSETARFRLVETSARLRSAQAATLNGTAGSFAWHETVDELPGGPLVIVGNEIFDALPVRQYVKAGASWRERMVDVDARGELRFVAGAGGVDPGLLPPDAAAARDGAVAEIAPGRAALMQAIAERLARDGGSGLFLDYGHLVPAVGDTLQAVRRHAFDDPLAHPGEADLTTHVDFAALAETARAAGLATRLATQGDFLIGMGLLERAGALGAALDEAGRARIRSQVERLAGPDQMGSLFKVLAVASDGDGLAGWPPQGMPGAGRTPD